MNQKGFADIILVGFVAFLLGAIAVYTWQHYKVVQLEQNVAIAKKTATAQQQKSPCDKTEDKRGCVVNGFEINTPRANEELCIGSSYLIKWTALADMETVTLTARQNSLSGKEVDLGTYRASQGSYNWKVNLPAGDVYQMWINSAYKGISVNDVSDGMFSVKQCS